MVRALRPPARLAERKKWIASPSHGPPSASAVRPFAPTARSRVVLSATALSPPSETPCVAYCHNLTQYTERFPHRYGVSARTGRLGPATCIRLFYEAWGRFGSSTGRLHAPDLDTNLVAPACHKVGKRARPADGTIRNARDAAPGVRGYNRGGDPSARGAAAWTTDGRPARKRWTD